MASLLENFNSNYVAAANRLTNKPKTVKVLVEDEYDIPFWSDLLNNNGQILFFDFTPFYAANGVENVAKGKKNLLRHATNLGPNLIICVDSAYGYLLPALTDEAKIINPSKYILQTYVYSIENYNCHAATLNRLCTNAAKQVVYYNFEEFIKKYSQVIYPLFVWSLLLETKEYGAITILPRTEAIKHMIADGSVVKIGEKALLEKIEKAVAKKKILIWKKLFLNMRLN